MNVTVNDIHDEHIRECMQKTIDYIVKLERENCGLKEYKKHQERAMKEDIVQGKSLGIEGQLSQRRSRWTK